MYEEEKKCINFDDILQDELFDRAKSEMLDEVMNLNIIKPQQW